jgi:hypothetical protein
MKTTFQHFVPRFLLRHFAIDGSKAGKEQISVYDLAQGKIFPSNLDRIAGSKKFYDYLTRSGKVASIDPALTNIEGLTAPAWRKLVEARDARRLNIDERAALALFVTTLSVRGPSTRAEISAIPRLAIEELRRRGEDTSLLEEWLRPEPGDDERIHVSTIEAIASVFSVVATRTWKVYSPPPGSRFCTSDSPVVKYNDLDYGPRGKLGLLQRGIVLQVALSPDALLLIADPEIYPIHEGTSEEYEPRNLLNYNHPLAHFAHRHLYSKALADFHVEPGMWSEGPPIGIVRPPIGPAS